MTRSSDQEMTAEEREEHMRVGAKIVADIKELLWSSSSAIKTNFTHDVKLKLGGTEDKPTLSPVIRLFFVITDLGGSVKEDIEKLIEGHLRFFSAQKENLGYEFFWSFAVQTKK